MTTGNDLDPLLRQAFDSLRDSPAPDPGRRAAGRRALIAEVHQRRADLARVRSRRAGPGFALRMARSLAVAIAVLAAASLATGGLAYAADSAGPGDALYGLDRAVESLRLGLAAGNQEAVQLNLEFADERLEELEQAVGEGNETNIEVAQAAYGHQVAAIAQTVGSAGGADQEALSALLDAALTVHTARLTELLAREDLPDAARQGLTRALEASQQGQAHGGPPEPGEQPGSRPGEAGQPTGNPGSGEPTGQPGSQAPLCERAAGPVVAQLVEETGAEPAAIEAWLCAGYGRGQVSFAYEASREASVPVEQVFELLEQGKSHREIREALGLEAGNPGGSGDSEGSRE